MANTLRFDLPMDGQRIRSLDQLQKHFTAEIIDHFRSGKLIKWLEDRNLSCELVAVDALKTENDTVIIDDTTVLKKLCRIFDIEASNDDIAISIEKITNIPGLGRLGQPQPYLHQLVLWIKVATHHLEKVIPNSLDDQLYSTDVYRFDNSISANFRFHYITWIIYQHMILESVNNCTDEQFANEIKSALSDRIDAMLSAHNISKDQYLNFYLPTPDYLKIPRSRSEIIRLLKDLDLLRDELEKFVERR